MVGPRTRRSTRRPFVLTHRPGPSIEMEGGTTFHFLDASPAEALDVARGPRTVGCPDRWRATIVREFLAAGLVDQMHVVVVPIVLGRAFGSGTASRALEHDYDVEAAPRLAASRT